MAYLLDEYSVFNTGINTAYPGKMRIEQYFLMTDYSLWEVILNGDSSVPTRVIDGVLQPVAPTMAEQRLARKNELKARGTLLMALPDKHQLKFNTHKDAKTLIEAIEKRFGVSDAASVSAVSSKIPVSSLLNVDKNLGSNGPTSMGFDMSKVECYNCHRKGHFARECRSPKNKRRNSAAEPQRKNVPVETSTSNALVSQCDGVGSYDWSFQVEAKPTNYALMAFSSSRLKSVEAKLLVYQQNKYVFEEDIKLLKLKVQLRDNVLVVLRQNLEKAEQEKDDLKIKLGKFQTTFKNLSELLASQTNDKTGLGYYSQVFTRAMFDCDDYLSSGSDDNLPPSPIYDRYQSGNRYHVVPPPYTGTFMPPKPDLVFNNAPNDVETDHPAFNVKLSPTKPDNDLYVVLATVLTQSKLVPINAVRPVTTAVSKTSVTRPRQAKTVVTKTKSPPRRHINHSPSPKASTFPPKVTAVKATMGNPQDALKDKRVINSGYLRHMIGNMSYLSDFEELNYGYVAFGGNLKGGNISGKGRIRTGKLDFDDVYFIKELKFNLFSVSQMCDKKNSVLFTDTECLLLSPEFKLPDKNQVLLRVPRENNMYNVNLKNIVPFGDLTCLFVKATFDESNLWHRRLGHINFKTMSKLVKGNLVRGLPTKVFENDNTCVACKKGKQHRASCKTKPISSVNQPLQRLRMDLFGPTFVKSLNKKSYCLVVTDDYSRFTWVFFLATKDETSPILKTYNTGLENKLNLMVKLIISDNGIEFKNNDLNQFCGMKGIKREFGVPRTPQQNGIAERKNRTLIEAAKTMLADSLLPISFWAKAVNTACYVQNRVLVTKPQNKTPYELLHGRTPSSGPTWLFDIDTLTKTMNYQPVTAGNQSNPTAGVQEQFDAEKAGEENNQQYVLFPVWSSGSTNPQNTDGDAAFNEKEPEFKEKKPESEVNVSPSGSAQSKKHDDKTKREAKGKSHVESLTGYRNLSAEFEDFSDNSINEDNVAGTLVPTVGQLSSNGTNTFSVAGPSNAAASPTHGKSSFDLPYGKRAMGTKWVFRNKKDERGIVVRNKARLSAFLYGTIEEEVYVCQPLGFEDPNYPDKVYKVVKALYGLHQAPRAWYETLANYLLENGFQKVKIDQTLFIKRQKGDILLVQIYVDDIIFGSTNKDFKAEEIWIFISKDKYVVEILRKFGLTDVKSASTLIDTEKPLLKDPDGEDVDVHTYRSMIGSLMYLTSTRPDIMFVVYARARFQVTPKASHLHVVKWIFRYLKGKPHLGLWYLKDSPFDLVAYSDSDYAGASLDRKSTTEGCQFLGCRLISWQCKKQTVMATSSTEAEYIAAASCCAQVLWIQNQLVDYGLIKYALTVNPNIFVSCIKQFWTSVAVKKVNNVMRLQALVDKKKVIITKASIRDALRLDDAEGVECLPNEEIFIELARMGYEKPSTKLTFYKAFFSSQWKFLIHTILQCMSAKRMSWNKFSSSMASVVICLSTGRKFNFLKYIFDSLVRNVDSSTTFYMYPHFLQLMIKKQVGDLSTHTTKYTSPALTQKVFANMRQVGKGFSGVETPLFEGMIVEHQVNEGDAEVNVDDVSTAGVAAEGDGSAANDEVPTAVEEPSIPSPTPPTPPPQPSQDGRMIADIDADVDVSLEGAKEVVVEKHADVDENVDDEGEPAELQEAAEVVTTAKLITEVVTAASATLTDVAPQLTIAATPTLTTAPSAARRRKRVVMRDPQETTPTSSTIIHSKAKSKDKGKGILKFNSNVAFLMKIKEQMDEEDSRALKRLSESQDDKTAKKQKLDEEKCSWSSEGQELEAVRVLWCADYHIYNNTVDFAGKEEISTHKVYSGSNG
uniref:Putative ribonuclease H-like domain-containing protein n=1 Tax=Tanacetum cinerariifolium TaxID=118510 RepID=A0A6L2LF23_TANCI|nr:putative ribonuclease H-like domain-containing protein [Tanacetum cinerariifolium]